jgi:phosphate starvation-inducible protein PhoH
VAERRVNQRTTTNNVQRARNFDQEMFDADSMRIRTARNAVIEVISSQKKLMKSVCEVYLVFVVANASTLMCDQFCSSFETEQQDPIW